MTETTVDIAVIGAGPAGMAVGLEAEKHGLSCVMIDKGSIVNTIRRYPTYATFFSTSELLELDNVPFPSLNKQPTRQEALRYYTKLALYRKLRFRLYETVHFIEKENQKFRVSTDKGHIFADKVVVATGYFEDYNHLNVEGEEREHVKHYYDEAFPYVGRRVVVIGGSNSAAEAILDLYRHGAEVCLVHRGEAIRDKIKYWLKPDLENRIKEGSIPAYFNAKIKAIRADEIQIEQYGKEINLKADHVLALTGFRPDQHLLDGAGVRINPQTLEPDFDPESHETNVEGLYVAGTTCTGIFTSKIFIENSRHHGKVIVDHIAKVPV